MKNKHSNGLSRRHFAFGLGAALYLGFFGEGIAKQVKKEIHELKPGGS